MIILLSGDDTYRSRQRLRTLRDAFRKKHDPSGVSTVRADGEKLTADELLTHLTVQGFFSTRRFVAVEGFLTNGHPAEQQAVLDALERMKFATDNVLVFWEPGDPPKQKGKGKAKADPGAALWQALAPTAKQERFASLDAAALATWYAAEIKRRGGTIERAALQRLLQNVGSDLWQASQEIEKLLHFKQDQLITESDVDQLVVAPFDESIFLLTDALGQRDAAAALRLLERQFQSGTEPLYLLRMLAWHARTLIGVWSLQANGMTDPGAIAREAKLHPFVAQKALRQVRLFSLDDLRALYRGIVEIDASIKSQPVDPRVLITLLLLAPSSSARATSSSRLPASPANRGELRGR